MAFFTSKKAAAILKHAVLDQYVDPFAMKTGSRSPGGRVAFIDGYAGEGRYGDGAEGSPALLISKAHKLSAHRRIECFFVEQDPATFRKLQRVVSSEAQGLTVEVVQGNVEDHLDDLLGKAGGIPLFVFFDPFGLMPPFDAVVKVFDRPYGLRAPATEVLINFNASGLRRIAGHLTSAHPNAATLERMDEVCGGSWWRKTWLDHLDDKDAAEEAVVEEYAKRLRKAARCGSWTFDVRNRADLKPAYHLVFLSRHPDGMLLFGDALSLGLEKWRKEVTRVENEGSLFDPDDVFKENETALAAGWVTEIGKNLRHLLSQGKTFTVLDRYDEVYGSSLGMAREKHLRKAWKELHAEGLTSTDSKGDLLKKPIDPA
jgi:three-Cys-motif partner protein